MERRKSTHRKKKPNKTAQKRNYNYRSVVLFFEKNKRWPSASSKNEKEMSLGQWIVRVAYLKRHHPERLPEKVIKLIERIEIDKNQKYEVHWENIYAKLLDFIEREKRWPKKNAADKEEQTLFNWCSTQKNVRRNNLTGSLNDERIKRLDSIGFKWDINGKKRTWDESFDLVKKFVKQNGRWPIHSSDPEESRLAKWCSKMRAYKNRTDTSVTLTPTQIRKLTKIGIKWEVEIIMLGRTKEQQEEVWMEKYNMFCEYIINNKRYPRNKAQNKYEEMLYSWWMRMAYLKRNGRLREDRAALLNKIGFRWGKEEPTKRE